MTTEIKMKTGILLKNFWIGLLGSFLFLFILSFISCQGTPVDVPEDEVFTKDKREQLGKLLMNDILSNYEFVPQVAPYDTSVYWYVQTLYTQATNIMQLDKQSPTDNRWTGGWNVYIIDDDETQHTFTLPGGDLFITTGMLKSFEKEYELYYLLTFEALLMHDNHLLDALKQEYNSLTLINLIEGRATASGVTIADLAADLPSLTFESTVIKAADRETVYTVCNTSILDPTGINPSLFNPHFQAAEWLSSRTNYGSRAADIQGWTDENSGDCGGNRGLGNYQRYVLDVLN